MPNPIVRPSAAALASLSQSQRDFIRALPKAELHAHLNGSIPPAVLQELAQEYDDRCGGRPYPDPSTAAAGQITNNVVQKMVKELLDPAGPPELNDVADFFTPFPAIYALTSTPDSLARATRGVLAAFLEPENSDDATADTPNGMTGVGNGNGSCCLPDHQPRHPQCVYLELRTTPRETPHMSREKYLRTVLLEMEPYSRQQPPRASLIVSLDRKMKPEVARECIDLATRFKTDGYPVVGVDLCGNPTIGNVHSFKELFKEARSAGLGVTLHIAETEENTSDEVLALLDFFPNRLGHATYLDDEARKIVEKRKLCIEICLSSNLLGKSVTSLGSHHIQHYLKQNHPIAICTDDILPFRTSVEEEYALLMAAPPLGLGLSEDEVGIVARMSLSNRFLRT